MPGTLLPAVFYQFFDANGAPLAGGKLASFLAGTSTPSPTYSDAALTTPHTNPIILDAAGRPGAVFLAALTYKFTLRDANDVLIATIDNVQATHVGQDNIGEVFTFGGDSTSPITATSYPAGTTIDKTHAGTSILNIDSGVLPAGTYVLEGMLIAGGGGTTSAALVNLSDGSPDAPIVAIASASTTGARQSSSTITFATPGAAKDYAIKTKVSGGFGFSWGNKLRKVA